MSSSRAKALKLRAGEVVILMVNSGFTGDRTKLYLAIYKDLEKRWRRGK